MRKSFYKVYRKIAYGTSFYEVEYYNDVDVVRCATPIDRCIAIIDSKTLRLFCRYLKSCGYWGHRTEDEVFYSRIISGQVETKYHTKAEAYYDDDFYIEKIDEDTLEEYVRASEPEDKSGSEDYSMTFMHEDTDDDELEFNDTEMEPKWLYLKDYKYRCDRDLLDYVRGITPIPESLRLPEDFTQITEPLPNKCFEIRHGHWEVEFTERLHVKQSFLWYEKAEYRC